MFLIIRYKENLQYKCIKECYYSLKLHQFYSSIVDRIVHHAVIVKILGDSYRSKNYLKKKFFLFLWYILMNIWHLFLNINTSLLLPDIEKAQIYQGFLPLIGQVLGFVDDTKYYYATLDEIIGNKLC